MPLSLSSDAFDSLHSFEHTHAHTHAHAHTLPVQMIVETIESLDTGSATEVVKTTLADLTATLRTITNEATGHVQLARQLLLRLPVATVPLQYLRHQVRWRN